MRAGPGLYKQPLTNHFFAVEIGGIEQAYFTECTGLQGEVEVLSYEEGGCNNFIHKRPGRSKFSNITLKKGFGDNDYMWRWFQGVVEGKIERRNLSLRLMDTDHSDVAKWDIFRAYPVKFVLSNLTNSQGEVLIETIELSHEGISLA